MICYHKTLEIVTFGEAPFVQHETYLATFWFEFFQDPIEVRSISFNGYVLKSFEAGSNLNLNGFVWNQQMNQQPVVSLAGALTFELYGMSDSCNIVYKLCQ